MKGIPFPLFMDDRHPQGIISSVSLISFLVLPKKVGYQYCQTTSSMSQSTFRERTLATRYQQRQQLPQNFPDVLKEYAREVLRAQPSDILSWSAEYFKALALEADPSAAPREPSGAPRRSPMGSPDADPEREELMHAMLAAFRQNDGNGDGRLYSRIMKRVLTQDFDLSPKQALYILTSEYAEVSEDDTLEYANFAREASLAVQFFQKSRQDFSEVNEDEGQLVHGMSRTDIVQEFLPQFRRLDTQSTGLISFSDYRYILTTAAVNLTNREIRLLCVECDRSHPNDKIAYELEVNEMFSRLVLGEQFEQFDKDL
ncbi:hypothetical protein AGDE_09802 [Angomonas deanei]|nr:hypothetical protein AGDE_09802 [Angomonas deanei]|eukprot:EPY29809.1 hypothetical protein AGDE_09802 [Angomonas deanei]